MRKLGAVLTSVVSLLGMGLVAGPPAQAWVGPSVTVTSDPQTEAYTIDPTQLDIGVGDTFRLVNSMNNGRESYVSVVNATGAVRQGLTDCTTPTSCRAADPLILAPGPLTLTVVSTGTVTIYRFLGVGDPFAIGTVTIGSTEPPAPQTFHVTFDHTCMIGDPAAEGSALDVEDGAKLTLPTSCTIANGQLVSWVQQGGLTFAPGSEVIVSADTTWTAKIDTAKAEVFFDANVSDNDACNNADKQNVPKGQRTSMLTGTRTGDNVSVTLPGAAVCTPPGFALTSWNTKGDGSGTSYPIDALGPIDVTIPGGQNSVTLFAVWRDLSQPRGNCAAPFSPTVDWRDCDKRGVQVFGAVGAARMQGANLSGAKFFGPIAGADFTGADLTGVSVTGPITTANFTRAVLVGTSVSGSVTTSKFGGATIDKMLVRGSFTANTLSKSTTLTSMTVLGSLINNTMTATQESHVAVSLNSGGNHPPN